jgi:hypothetical protein
MKKFLPIIVGLCSGILLSGALIFNHEVNTAYGDSEDGVSPWSEAVSALEAKGWEAIFGEVTTAAEQGKHTYALIYDKLAERGEREALKEVASMYGLTTEEAKSVLGGSMLPIFNNPDNNSPSMTQEMAAAMMVDMQEKFQFLKELLEIEQEVDIAIAPSEIFSNGDLEDSGFDLVQDLSIIEIILFNEESEPSVGGEFGSAFGSPIPQSYKDSVNGFVGVSNGSDGEGSDGLNLNDDGSASIGVGEGNVDAEVLDDDVCPEEDVWGDALRNNEEANTDDDGGGSDDDPEPPSGLEAGEPVAAVGDEWGSEFCPGGIGGEVDSGAVAGADEGFSVDSLPDAFNEMTSLGGGSLIGADAGAGAGGSFEAPGFEMNVGVCLTVEMIKGTTSNADNNGPTCLECEIDAINSLLEETLSHSLVAHKTTGNIMESGKCKDPGVPISLNFVTIWNPVSTPPNDDLILGKNIFEEWNKFGEKYKPLLLDKISFSDPDMPHLDNSTQSEIIQKTAPAGYSQGQLLNDLLTVKNKYAAEAAGAVESFDLANVGTNGMLYTTNVLAEIKQMNVLFKNYNETYKKIIESAFANTISKGYQDG